MSSLIRKVFSNLEHAHTHTHKQIHAHTLLRTFMYMYTGMPFKGPGESVLQIHNSAVYVHIGNMYVLVRNICMYIHTYRQTVYKYWWFIEWGRRRLPQYLPA